MSKKILVIGGAGFIGSNLCRRLVAEGHNVTSFDNYYNSSFQNLAELDERMKIWNGDVREEFAEISVWGEYEHIYNLACPASPPIYQRDPIYTHEVSAIGVRNVLKLAEQSGARVLQASTSEIYGDPVVHPQPETYWGNVNSVGPRSCYDEGKRFAETMCYDYHHHRDVDVRVARIFNTYGPYMDPDDGRVISNFIVQGLRGLPLTIYGQGQQTRSFCYVDDLVDGLIKLMNSDVTSPVNLGNPNEFMICELYELVQEVFENLGLPEVRRTFCQMPIDDPKQRRPDISKAQKELEWNPTIQLREGLRKTIEYFKSKV